MSIFNVAQAKKTPQIVIRDNNGDVLSVVTPKDLQVGFEGNPGDLILKGGLDINTSVINITTSTSYRIKNDDIALFFNNSSGTNLSVLLPTPPRRKGQLHIVKDFLGTAAAHNIVVSTTDGSLIDGAASQTIQVAYGAIMFVWTGSAWVSLALGASGAGSVAPGGGGGGGGDPGPSYLTLSTTASLYNERVLTVSGSTGLQLTDAGANSTATLSLTNTGVVAGTYECPTTTVDAQGRVTKIYSYPIWRMHTGSIWYVTPGVNVNYFYVNGTDYQLWVVPYGVSQINFQLWGAGGGGVTADIAPESYIISTGGAGGWTSGSVAVTAGQIILVGVGNPGQMGGNSAYGNYGGFGGWVDGGNTSYYDGGGANHYWGGGGGGATRLIGPQWTFQAGGGGGGGVSKPTFPAADGENGGGASGGGAGTGGYQDGGVGSAGISGPGVTTFKEDAYTAIRYPYATGSAYYFTGNLNYYGSSANNYIGIGRNGSVGGTHTKGHGLAVIEYYVSSSYSRTIAYTTSSVAIVNSESEIDSIVPLDAKFFVTGTRGLYGLSASLSIFGGDTKVSGALQAIDGLSGSLTKLTDGRSYLVAGQGIDIVSSSNAQVTILNRAPADLSASYLLLKSTSSLPNGQLFSISGSSGLKIVNTSNTASLSIYDGIVATVSGTRFTGPVIAAGGLSGSLQRLATGETYLVAGQNVSIVTGSNGQITIAASTGSAFFDETATYITLTNTSSLANERALSVSGTTGLKLVDNGANSTVVLSINDNVVATVSGTRFTGNVIATSGLSGSLQQTSSGISYLVAGAYITIVTGSNGQVTITNSFPYVTGTWRDAVNTLITTGSVSIDTGNRAPSTIGSDVFFFVSGSKGISSGKSIFGGDLVVSGTIKSFGGLSGSLTTLATGESYLVAGANVTIITGSNGQVTINSSGGGGGSGDPDATYVTLSTTSSLNKERVLTVSGSTGLLLSDGGANGNVTLSIYDGIVATVSGTTFTGPVSASAGLSGSLQRIGPNLPYLVAGSNVIITTSSNGQVNISAQFTITGSTTPYQFPIFHGTVSTQQPSSSKYSVGMCYYDPTKVPVGTKTWYFRSIISPTTGTIAYLELYDYNGIVSSPPIPIETSIVTASNSNSFIYFEKNISNAMSGIVTPGIIEARMWCSPTITNGEAVLKNAKIDIEFS